MRWREAAGGVAAWVALGGCSWLGGGGPPSPWGHHLKNVRQLTDDGTNAEGYFSPDGRRLIFQSTRGGVPCDRMFVMDLWTGGIRRVGPERGRATCGFFLDPKGERILFASTHLAEDACPPPPDRSHGYVWAVDPAFDLFSARSDGTDVRRLTEAPGYDAEATVCRDGSKVVFTSARTGDLELFLMNPDGSDQHPLTHETGYDGGGFFSPDCRRVVFRAERPPTPEAREAYLTLLGQGLVHPGVLEIYTIGADGSDLQGVTHLGRASFAPAFHPDGERIVFSSNLEGGGRGFDLYLVHADGSGLEALTRGAGFASFPMWSPDGRRMVFASTYGAKKPGEMNLFLADWRD